MTNEFYYEDLKGLQIKIDGSIQKGIVNDVFNFGSGDVLEVSLDDKKATIYIPFDRDNVSKNRLKLKGNFIDTYKRLTYLNSIK